MENRYAEARPNAAAMIAAFCPGGVMRTSVSADAAHRRMTLIGVQGIRNLPPKIVLVKASGTVSGWN